LAPHCSLSGAPYPFIISYPDVANNYVQVITQWPGHAAEEVEQQVTIPVEIVMNGIPHLDHLRSFSVFGLSSLMLIFDDESTDDWDRQKVLERLSQVGLPAGLQPQIGSDYSPVGQISWYTLRTSSPPTCQSSHCSVWRDGFSSRWRGPYRSRCLGALIFSMLIAPVLCSIVFGERTTEWRNPGMVLLTFAYRKTLGYAIRWRWLTVGVALAALGASAYLMESGIIGS
jgi:Cu/Ag efflux pump CusA